MFLAGGGEGLLLYPERYWFQAVSFQYSGGCGAVCGCRFGATNFCRVPDLRVDFAVVRPGTIGPIYYGRPALQQGKGEGDYAHIESGDGQPQSNPGS